MNKVFVELPTSVQSKLISKKTRKTEETNKDNRKHARKTEQDGKSSGESELPSNSRTIAATLGTNRSKLASDWLLDGAFNRSSTRGLFIRVLFEVVASVLRIRYNWVAGGL